MQDRIGSIVMPLGGQSSGLPDLADGVGAETDDPTSDQDLECVEDLDAEAVTKGFYQRSHAGDKLIHGAGLRAEVLRVVVDYSQDTNFARICPLSSSHR
jgi:hypothetical protein